MGINILPFTIHHSDWFDFWLGDYQGEKFSPVREIIRKRKVSMSYYISKLQNHQSLGREKYITKTERKKLWLEEIQFN